MNGPKNPLAAAPASPPISEGARPHAIETSNILCECGHGRIHHDEETLCLIDLCPCIRFKRVPNPSGATFPPTPTVKGEVEAEREACAKIAEAETELVGGMPEKLYLLPVEDVARAACRATKRSIATAIRARTTPEGR